MGRYLCTFRVVTSLSDLGGLLGQRGRLWGARLLDWAAPCWFGVVAVRVEVVRFEGQAVRDRGCGLSA